MKSASAKAVSPLTVSLQKTLEKTAAVAVDIDSASHQMSVVATVLEATLPTDLQVGEVAQVLRHTGALESRLKKSACVLAEVNAALATAIDQLAVVMEQLDQANTRVKKLEVEQRERND